MHIKQTLISQNDIWTLWMTFHEFGDIWFCEGGWGHGDTANHVHINHKEYQHDSGTFVGALMSTITTRDIISYPHSLCLVPHTW